MQTVRLTKRERHELILSEIRKSGAIRISKLAKRIGVVGETIRRDLIELGDAGLINRSYGGATISLVTTEPVIAERGLTMVEERARIGRACAGLIEDRQVIMVDGGSTTYEVARQLALLRRDLVIITNSVGIAAVADGNPTFRVILCPGTYDNREGSVLGEDTIEYIRRYNAATAIIGASGITTDGPCDMVSGAAAVKRAMIARSLSTILAVTHDKFARASLERICSFNEMSDVVTDAEPTPDFRGVIEGAGAELHVIDAES